jgi:hypothetical protein
MATIAPQPLVQTGIADTLTALARAEGSAAHCYATGESLIRGKHATRDLADAVHYLCTLHGRQPGVVDHAASRTAHNAARSWFLAAVDGFLVERLFLTKLGVAAGPLPSTPGQAESEAAVTGQHHALEMLAQSDRSGCAVGAAAALVLDWHALRVVLDHAGHRLGVDIPACTLPSVAHTLEMAASVSETPAVERAFAFGAHQVLSQHHGLWDLLEARQIARGEY